MDLNFGEIVLGGIVGLALTICVDAIRTAMRRRKISSAFCGRWTRDEHAEYLGGVDPRMLRKHMYMSMSAQAPTGLEALIEYDKESRGTTVSLLTVYDSLDGAEGAYVYPYAEDPCYRHAGLYGIHLVRDGVITLYYEGTYPVKGAAGFEVWTKDLQKRCAWYRMDRVS